MNNQAIKPANRISEIGEYYFSKKLAEVREMQKSGKPVLNLGIGNPDIMPHSDVLDKMISISQNTDSHFYQSYKGVNQLRNAYSSWYMKNYNIKLNSETEVLPLAGSKEGIMLVTMAFVNPGDRVLIPDPGYPAYTSMAKMAGAEIVYYQLDEQNNWLPDFNQLNRINQEKEIKLMWVNYPHMPTGTKANEQVFKQLAYFSEKNNILICNDNPYSLILNDNPISLLKFSNISNLLIELNSLSKSHSMQGLRQGVAIANQTIIDYLLRVKSNYDSGMYLPLQEAAVTAMNLSDDWNKKINKIYNERRLKIFQMLDVLDCKYEKDTAGLFVWAKVSGKYKNGLQLADKLLYDLNIFVAPGKIFGKQGENYVRFSISSSDNQINEALLRIKTMI